MPTTFMNLTLPTVSVTLGPEWASELNSALDAVDAHDHSSGKGVPVAPAGMDINDDLDFQAHRALDLKSSKYDDQTGTLVGATNANSVYTYAGNLYFTNSSGVAVQITSGGSVITTPGAVQSFQYDLFASDLVIAPADPYVFMEFDTTVARTVTLPLASGVAAGRIYIIKDGSLLSETNPASLVASGADTIEGLASQSLASNGGAFMIIGNGVDKWFFA